MPDDAPTSPSGPVGARSLSCFSSSRLRSKSIFRSAALVTARATSSTSSKGFVR